MFRKEHSPVDLTSNSSNENYKDIGFIPKLGEVTLMVDRADFSAETIWNEDLINQFMQSGSI